MRQRACADASALGSAPARRRGLPAVGGGDAEDGAGSRETAGALPPYLPGCRPRAPAQHGSNAMPRPSAVLALLACLAAGPASSGEAEIRSAQSAIQGQLEAFRADDPARAYSFAAPSIKRIFPTVESFMSMVEGGYKPVRKPQSYAFGKSQEMSATAIVQQVLLVGPDGKDWEAVYTLELQPDGSWLITGVSLRASNALST
jgi:hypothetical protein